MIHDPRCCGVTARTGPGVLWWGKTTPCVSPPCPWQCLLSRPAVLQSAAVACVGNPALSWRNACSLRTAVW
eukprot:5019445-Prymnesium_polylepis.1